MPQIRTLFHSLFLILAITLFNIPVPTVAQTAFSASDPVAETAVEIPNELTPEIINGLLSRLTDAEVRATLSEELQRQAAKQAEEAVTMDSFFVMAEARLTKMFTTIGERITRWADRIINIHTRFDEFNKRIDRAEAGVIGMVFAVITLVGAGVGAAIITNLLTRKLRDRVTDVTNAGYWTRLLRTVVLGVLEFLSITAFAVVTQIALPFLRPALGPMAGMGWIYTTGVWWCWLAILISRRAFAPYTPQIRITTLEDGSAMRIHNVLRNCVKISLSGWLLGGTFLNLGFGFPPALTTVALAGTTAIVYLLYYVLNNVANIQNAAQYAINHAQPVVGKPTSIIALATPWLVSAYIFCAGTYWLLHRIESGQHRLYGPLGTLVVFLTLPIFDRLGTEFINTFLNTTTAAGQRFRDVLYGTWRIIYIVVAIFVVFGFWNINLLNFAKGENAPMWASAGFDIITTVLIGYMIWKLIKAALHTEVRENVGSEDADPEAPEITRLDTLIPLFRNILLGILAIVVLMITLSAIGVDIGPLIASAGIVGIAIGFGAQTLVRDIFSGVFFLVDDAFRVGEYIELDKETRGEVESISIRSLQLRHHRGAVITIPFGELLKITNHNREWVIFKMPFRMEPSTDPQKFKKVVRAVGAEFLEHPEHGPKFIEPLKSQGVFFVDDDSALVMRVKFKCLPRAQFVLRREIYHRLRSAFEENDLHIARRKVEVVSTTEDLAGAVVEEAQKKTAEP